MISGLPKFDYTWTFGNTIQVILICFAGVTVWTQINEQISTQAILIQQNQDQILEMRKEILEERGRIRALELGAGRVEEKLISIGASLARIERVLENGDR